MSVREYIGARYVPIFGRKDETTIDWDDTKPYEPLTIVLHEGNSYTSRQYVPAGIPITNQTYWALTGNYNAQIEAYRAEVQGFADDIQANADAITAINGEIGTGFTSENTIANAISAIDDEIGDGFSSDNTVADAVDDINARINQIVSDKTLIVFGDSWATSPNAWIQKYAAYKGFTTYKTYAVIGATFTTRSSNLIQTQLIAAAADDTIRKDAVTEVVIIGGVNDYRDNPDTPASVGGAIKPFIDDVRALYPKALVRYALDCQVFGYPFSWYASFSSAALNKGFENIPLCDCMAFNNYAYETDELHPNSTGQNIIVQTLLNPAPMSFGTSVVTSADVTSSNEHVTCNALSIRKMGHTLVSRWEIRISQNLSSQAVLSLPTPYNNIIADRLHSVTSEFTSVNAGKYAIGYNGGLALASNTVAATDYVTIMTHLPY